MSRAGPSSREKTSALERLRAAAKTIASDACPECPVCLEVPSADEARILRCCSAILCRTCVPLCGGVCPCCRRTFEALGESCSHDQADCIARAILAGESPHTYSTHEYKATLDYSKHSDYVATADYTTTLDYTTTADYTSSTDYASHLDYAVTTDYGAHNDYTVSGDYRSTVDYAVRNDYSTTSNEYVANGYDAAATADYSEIAQRYSSPN
jgi:hypothetical protein